MFENMTTLGTFNKKELETEIHERLEPFLFAKVERPTLDAINQMLNDLLLEYHRLGKDVFEKNDDQYYRLTGFRVSISPADPSMLLCDPVWKKLPDCFMPFE